MDTPELPKEEKKKDWQWRITTIVAIAGLGLSIFNAYSSAHNQNTMKELSESGIVLQGESNGTQKTATTIAQKSLDLENQKLLVGWSQEIAQNPIFYCGEDNVTEEQQKKCNDFNDSKPDNKDIQQGISALVVIGNYLNKDIPQGEILQFFPSGMAYKLCNSHDIYKVIHSDPIRSKIRDKACVVLGP